MKKGDIVVNRHGLDYRYIFVFDSFGKTWVKGTHILNVYHKEFIKDYNYSNGIGVEVRLATPEEKLWFETCLAQNRYIPFEKINYQPQYEIY